MENLILSPDPKKFIYNFGQIEITSLFFYPNCKSSDTTNLWIIKFNCVNWKTSIKGKILHRTNIPLNYNLPLLSGSNFKPYRKQFNRTWINYTRIEKHVII